jgi:hypothetical protein
MDGCRRVHRDASATIHRIEIVAFIGRVIVTLTLCSGFILATITDDDGDTSCGGG